MDLSDILGHSSNVLYLIGFMLRNILWMRLFVMTAAVIEVGYCFLGTLNPWTGAPWAVATIVVNGYHFVALLAEKGTINFNTEERTIHQELFPMMNLIQFKRLLHIARWHTFGERSEIIKEGAECRDLVLIIEGESLVRMGGTEVARLGKNVFAGEMSYLTGEPTTASVVAVDTVRCLVWRGEELRKLMEKDQDVAMPLNMVFNKMLVRKLAETSKVAATRAPFAMPTSKSSIFARMISAATPALFRKKPSRPPVPPREGR